MYDDVIAIGVGIGLLSNPKHYRLIRPQSFSGSNAEFPDDEHQYRMIIYNIYSKNHLLPESSIAGDTPLNCSCYIQAEVESHSTTLRDFVPLFNLT